MHLQDIMELLARPLPQEQAWAILYRSATLLKRIWRQRRRDEQPIHPIDPQFVRMATDGSIDIQWEGAMRSRGKKKYTFLLMSSRLLGKGLVAATKREVNRSDLRVSDSLMTRTLRTARVLPRAQRLSRARLRFGERRRARARRRFGASSRRHGWLRRRQRRRRQRCRRFRWNYGGRKRRRMRTCMATGSRDANVGKMTETFPFLSSEGLRETIAFARRGRFSLRLHVSIARERGEKSLLDATQGCPNRLRTSSRRSTL